MAERKRIMNRVFFFWCALLVAAPACQAPSRILSEAPPEAVATAAVGIASTQPIDPDPVAPVTEPLTLVSWQEPTVGAFVASVPQGWEVQGGISSSFGVLHRWIMMARPDGSAAIQVGYRELTLHLLPHPLLEEEGYPTGTTLPLDNGLQVLVAPCQNGETVAEAEARARLQTVCTDLSISDQRNTDRHVGPELVTSEGAVAFECSAEEGTWSGELHAVTSKLIDPGQGSGIWFSDDIAWYAATAGQGEQAASAFQAVLASLRFDPQWVAAQEPVASMAGLFHDQNTQANGSSGQFFEDDVADFFARQSTGQ